MFYSGALHPADPGFILGGFRDFGSVVQENGRPSWRALAQSVTAEGEVAVSASHPDTDWMVSRGAILRTTDGGQSAIEADDGIDWSGSAFVQPVRKCPSNDNVVLAGTTRLWRTDNFFSSTVPTWALNGPPGDVVPTIESIAYAASDTTCSTYAYGTRGGRVLMTQKRGCHMDRARSMPNAPASCNQLVGIRTRQSERVVRRALQL